MTTHSTLFTHGDFGLQALLSAVSSPEGGETLAGMGTRSSTRPLTLEQLVGFLLFNWDLIYCLDCNFENRGHPRDQILDFVVDDYSGFYGFWQR